MEEVELNKIEPIHKGRIFEIVRETITLPNEISVDLEIIRHPGAALMVPLVDSEEVILIKQYRHAVKRFIWEFPAGTLAKGESPLECAKRELIEEIGYSAAQWDKLGEIIPVPGYSDEVIHVFLARNLTCCTQHLDPDEILEVHKVKFEEAMQMIARGEICDSKSISALFLTDLRLKGKK